jgi:hypothetical protein
VNALWWQPLSYHSGKYSNKYRQIWGFIVMHYILVSFLKKVVFHTWYLKMWYVIRFQFKYIVVVWILNKHRNIFHNATACHLYVKKQQSYCRMINFILMLYVLMFVFFQLLEQFRSENQRLKDENGALIRVISKLSKWCSRITPLATYMFVYSNVIYY